MEEVKLSNIETFRKALENYHVSEHAKKVIEHANIVVMVGVAGGGRNTIIRELVQTGRYDFIVSDTTRPPKMRDGKMEQNGVQYYFRSEDEVLQDILDGEFLEAELIHEQQVSGMSIREIERSVSTGKISLNEVELFGALNVVKAKPDAICVFILPPSFDEWIQRWQQREKISGEEFDRRMDTAERNIRLSLEQSKFHFIVNDNLEEAVRLVDNLANGKLPAVDQEKAARDRAKQLLADIVAHRS